MVFAWALIFKSTVAELLHSREQQKWYNNIATGAFILSVSIFS